MNRLFFILSKSGHLEINIIRLRPRWQRPFFRLLYWLTWPFYWRQRRAARRGYDALKLEIQQAAQDTLNAAMDGFRRALEFLDTIPSYEPEERRPVKYRNPRVLLTANSRPRRHRPRSQCRGVRQ